MTTSSRPKQRRFPWGLLVLAAAAGAAVVWWLRSRGDDDEAQGAPIRSVPDRSEDDAAAASLR